MIVNKSDGYYCIWDSLVYQDLQHRFFKSSWTTW